MLGVRTPLLFRNHVTTQRKCTYLHPKGCYDHHETSHTVSMTRESCNTSLLDLAKKEIAT